MSTFPAGLPLDVRVAGAINCAYDPGDWVYDEKYPSFTSELCWSRAKWLLWRFQYDMDGTLPPGTRVLCGIATPGYSGDLMLAHETAIDNGVTYLSTDTAAQVCCKILDAKGAPWNTP